ncbi:MAG: FkbM family methyltransferase [Pseudomonadales bacterium]
MSPSAMLIQFGDRHPTLAKVLTNWSARAWVTLGLKRYRHWLMRNLVQRYFVRVPVRAKLPNGLTIIVPWCDQVGDEILSGDYEPETLHLLDQLIKPGMTVLDAGAHAGIYSLYASSLVGPKGQVHTFEAEPALASWIERSIALNHLHNVTVNATILSDVEGEVSFFRASDASVNSLVEPRDVYSYEVVRLPSTTLRGYLAKTGIDRIDLIKMDIEGAELTVLATVQDLLSTSERLMLIIEFAESRASLEALAAFLVQCGYRLFRIAPHGFEAFGPDSVPRLAKPGAPATAFNALAMSPDQPLPAVAPQAPAAD